MKTCLIVALSLTLIACAATTPRIDPARLSEVQKGKTTVAEVVRQFGRPSVLSKNPEGTQSAMYVHSDGQSGGTTVVPLVTAIPRDSVTFYFDTKGVLTDVRTTQANANSPAPADANKTTQASSDKLVPASAKQTPQGNTNRWSLPSWLPPSTTQNR